MKPSKSTIDATVALEEYDAAHEFAKRLECAQLAAAFFTARPLKSDSNLYALQTHHDKTPRRQTTKALKF
jgi:hypothetical protein